MKFLLAILLIAFVAAKTEVHYHYHGLNPSSIDKHDGLFSDSAFCSYTGKSSKLNIFASKEGWYCDKGPWENCTQQCDNSGCRWVCIKTIPNKASPARANGGVVNANVNTNVGLNRKMNSK